jgi:hypothetical protein
MYILGPPRKTGAFEKALGLPRRLWGHPCPYQKDGLDESLQLFFYQPMFLVKSPENAF